VPRALLFADAGASTGLGHVARTAALGVALASHGASVVLATPDDTARALVEAEGLEWCSWDRRLRDRVDILVADSYDWGRAEEDAGRMRADLFVRILDGTPRHTSAHVVVDGAPGAAGDYIGPSLVASFGICSSNSQGRG